MSIQVISPGFYSTVQDLGRFGHQHYGVPQSGVMDRYSAKVANLLVGNPSNSAVIEMTMLGAELKFKVDTLIAVSGLEAQLRLNNKKIAINQAHLVKKGDSLKVKQISKGFRAYLAVKGGIQTKMVLGSRSFYKHITASEKLELGDILPILKTDLKDIKARATIKFKENFYNSKTVEVSKGPEWEYLPKVLQEKLIKSSFKISKNNSRQAYQLRETLKNNLKPILTQPVLPGTVQLTPNGNIIILMRDCQVTGGYPRIFQLTERSINKIAQKRVNDTICFIWNDFE